MNEPQINRGWALILAAGDGPRVRSLREPATGARIPRQFCAFGGEVSLLQRTLRRAGTMVDSGRIAAVVNRAHRRWWTPELAGLSRDRIVVEPRGRGTAMGTLLPLLHIARRDPTTHVVILPTNHGVVDEARLRVAISRAFGVADDDAVILLGMTPERAEPSVGYIVPSGPSRELTPIARFVDKPPPTAARTLVEAGALWNSSIFVGRVHAFLELFEATLPELLSGLRRLVDNPHPDGVDLEDFYEYVPSRDLSRDVLEPGIARLRVLRVPRCGWVDLGAPEPRAPASNAGRDARVEAPPR